MGRVHARNSGSIEQEANASRRLSLTVAKRVHQLLELSRPLDLEEHFIVTVGDLDVEVLGLFAGFRLGGGAVVGVGHVVLAFGVRYLAGLVGDG